MWEIWGIGCDSPLTASGVANREKNYYGHSIVKVYEHEGAVTIATVMRILRVVLAGCACSVLKHEPHQTDVHLWEPVFDHGRRG